LARILNWLWVWALIGLSAVSIANADDRPNLLFVVADDQAEWVMGCSGYKEAKTPNMDRLSREGVRLTNCFTPTPVCSPSRVAILTSRYGTEVGIYDWLNPNKEPLHGLDPATVAWPRILSAAGYRTGLVGKWHLGLQEQFQPDKFGYQYFMGFLPGGVTPQNPELTIDGEKRTVTGFVVDLLVDDALDFLRKEPGRPFALSVHFREPHSPYTPLPESEAQWSATVDPKVPNPDFPRLNIAKVKQLTKDYLGSVAAIDRNLGRMLDELDRLKLNNNTLVIYTSDHGYNIGQHGVLHKGNGSWILTENPPATEHIPSGLRPNMFDTSLRVPALIRWPKRIPPGKTIDRTITHLDWLPTILSATGTNLPANTKIHGQSILPLISGQGPLDRSDDLYAEFSVQHTMRSDMRSYRTKRWKLMQDFLNPGRDELYDLQADPEETTNLGNSERQDAQDAYKQLAQLIRAKMAELHDPFLK